MVTSGVFLRAYQESRFDVYFCFLKHSMQIATTFMCARERFLG